MRQVRTFTRLAALALMVGMALWVAMPARSQSKKGKRIDTSSKDEILKRNVQFQPPPKLAKYKRTGNVVEIELVVSIKKHKIDANQHGQPDEILTRPYGDELCGPLIRVKPGDL